MTVPLPQRPRVGTVGAARIVGAAATLAATLLASSPARADDTPRRKAPDYDGRGSEPATAGDVALWVPRVVFFPVYLVTELLIRRPLGWLVVAAERNNLPAAIADFLTFDKDHKIGITPTAFLDFGFRPSVGAYFFWDDFGAKGNDLRLYGSTWGPDWLTASVADRVSLGPKESAVMFRASFTRRKDWVFHGLGPRSLESDRSRYSSDAIDVGARLDTKLGRAVSFHSAVGVRSTAFESPVCCVAGDPSIADSIAGGRFATPPGFASGYTAAYQRLHVSLDTRQKWPEHGSGVRVALEGEPAFDLSRRPGSSWINYGATVGGYLDVTGTRRVVGLVVSTSFVDPIHGDSVIPFTEQPTLGGTGFLRGFRPGRLIGRSSVVAQLEYRWPIWMWIDGSMQLGVGNVFGPTLAGFDPKLLRLSGSIGVRTSNSPDHQIEVLVGGGTETFDQGAKLSSVRIFFGGTRGF